MSVIQRAECIALLIVAIFLGVSGCHRSAREFIYVISPQGAVVKIAADTLSIVGQGDLRSEKITEVDSVIADPERRDILLETTRAWSATASGPTPGIAILRGAAEKEAKSLLRLVHSIAPPTGMDQLLGAIVVKSPHRMVLTSWSAEQDGASGVTLATAENDQFHEPRKIEDFQLGNATCASGDGSRLLAFSTAKLAEVQALDLADMTVRKVPISGADLSALLPVLTVGDKEGCRVLLVGRSPDTSDDKGRAPALVYDLDRQATVGKFSVAVPGQYYLADAGTLVLVDERTLTPNLLPTGQTVGMRYKKPGRLHVLEAATGQEIALLKLPEDGGLAASDGPTGYYLSPGSLSVLDLKAGTIRATVKVPFSSGFIALQSER